MSTQRSQWSEEVWPFPRAHACAALAAIGLASCILTAAPADAKTLAYVTSPYSGTIKVIDTATNAVINTLPFGPAPKAIASSLDGRFVYVGDSGLLLVIDTSKQAAVATLDVGNVSSIAPSPDGRFIYALHGYDVVAIIDPATNLLVNDVVLQNAGYNWQSMAVGRDGTVYFGKRVRDSSGNGSLAVLDPATQSVTFVTFPGTYVHAIALSPSADFGYITVDQGIEVLDTTTNTITKTIPPASVTGPGWPPESVEVFEQVVFSSDGTRAYVVAANSSRIVVMDSAQQEPIGSIPIVSLFADLAFGPDGHSLYGLVESRPSGDPGLIVIDTTTGQVVDTGLRDDDGLTDDSRIAFVTVPDSVPCVPDVKTCTALVCSGDGNGDGKVTVEEIMSVVDNALDGCSASQP